MGKRKTQHTRIISHPEKLSSYWKSEFGLCCLITITGLIYNFGMLAGPYFQGRLVDEVISPDNTFSSVLQVVLIYILTIFIVQLFRSLKRYFVRRFANNTTASMRLNIENNIMHEPNGELSQENIGRLLTRSQSDVSESVEGMRKLTTEIFDTVALFIFYIIYLFFFDVKMTAFAMISVLVAIIFAFSFRKRTYTVTSEARKQNSRLSSETYDLSDNALLYRLNSRDEDNLRHYDTTLGKYEKSNVRSGLYANIFMPIANVIALIGLIPIIYLGIGYVMKGQAVSVPLQFLDSDHWTTGLFTTYLTTYVLLCSKASHTAKLFSSVEKGLSSWKRISPYMKPYASYEESVVRDNKDGLTMQEVSLVINGKTLLKPFSLKARPGEIIAITGPVASGKSALGKVFLKELPYQGSINLFGKELSSYSDGEIKGNIVYMGHKPDLFSSTIRTNIAYDETKDVNPYLEDVSFTKDLETMPEKENTLIGSEGVRLSGGQQERIALARTLYHRKNLMILDDPFASIDVRTEHEIMSRLRLEEKDSIIILFSHRLSYFPYCDQVLCFNKDQSVASGTHASLLKESSTYRELYELQKQEETGK